MRKKKHYINIEIRFVRDIERPMWNAMRVGVDAHAFRLEIKRLSNSEQARLCHVIQDALNSSAKNLISYAKTMDRLFAVKSRKKRDT